MSVIEDSMMAAAKVAEAAAHFCRTMMRLEHPSHYKETREEQFVSDWFVTRKMDKEPTYADAIKWADKTMIDKAVEWLENNWREYVYQDGDGVVHFGHYENDFRKAMEE